MKPLHQFQNVQRMDYTAMLIEDFLEEFKVLYPERSLTPKMHYLVHIPTWTKWYAHQFLDDHNSYDCM